ncbi:hypothetical protein B484DRAFT_459473 [Ochromonadaceae sp. CCMP2298]|nr:hypothetical protein B484DRAFT_459473 [Ochromonadaceae sp. CCMP2298]
MFGKKEMRILMVGLDAAGKVRFPTSAVDYRFACRSQKIALTALPLPHWPLRPPFFTS